MLTKKGGKVIASGGFGCIFSPSLKCKSNYDTSNYDTSNISKLMLTKSANDEYNQIEKFKNTLTTIPNYINYFLLDNFTLCKPDKLTKDDLHGFTKKCKSLKKKGFTLKNINDSIDKLMIINMPDGGINVREFIDEYFSSNIMNLNNSLIDLLVNGIVPMNKLNVYHGDIKDENVLVKKSDTGLITRLIDWGLSISHINNTGIPRKIYRRPFQFNVPFSSIIFNKVFIELYDNFLVINNEPDYFQIREFVINYIFIWNDIRGPGHLSSINNIIKKLTLKDITAIKKKKIKAHFIEYDFTYYYIIEYLSKILQKYTNKGTFDIMSYFENVFLKNIDIWGFTMIYISFYEYLYKSFDKLNDYQIQFINKVKYIIIHFLYESPIEPINISLLVDELTSLNEVIKNFNVNTFSKAAYLSDVQKNVGGKYNKNKTYKLKNNKNNKGKTRKMSHK